MITNVALERYLAGLLDVTHFRDYAPNGLQVEGRASIGSIVTGVTASQALLEAAVALEADAVLVHHGYFWKNEAVVLRGMKRRRIATLLAHDINLFAYHLPLDAHPELGNNAQLARRLGILPQGVLPAPELQGVGNLGCLPEAVTLADFGQQVTQALGRAPLLVSGGEHAIRSIGWCTGGAQGYIGHAIALGLDAFLSGEVSENTVHEARESGVHYIAAGHHATERYGIQALGEHLAGQFGLQHKFVDIDNPA
ncbi:MAG: Nif3-like dinuclear metal center hexameric protein [Thiothrix sp.]|nr:Nif3-like dinuclear metal center hexameric protein [Thiothrix sp.]HPE59326.1 Nif3-like dinuclear metal center hexameric protein [Thiolinea sp.]